MILFSKRLKEKRKEMGLTQKQLGDMIGVLKLVFVVMKMVLELLL